MSSEIAFKLEDAEGLPSQIAFNPAEATIPRYIRRAEEKAKKQAGMYAQCIDCGYIEFTDKVSFEVKKKDPATGMESVVGRVHRQCPKCNGNMVKINDRRQMKKYGRRK